MINYTCICVCVYTYIYMYTNMYVCMYVCMYIYIYIWPIPFTFSWVWQRNADMFPNNVILVMGLPTLQTTPLLKTPPLSTQMINVWVWIIHFFYNGVTCVCPWRALTHMGCVSPSVSPFNMNENLGGLGVPHFRTLPIWVWAPSIMGTHDAIWIKFHK